MEITQHEDEIDLIALLKQLWVKRMWILKVGTLFVFLGIVVALVTPTKYKAETVFIPQTSETGGAASKFGGLASLAGISLGGMSDGMSIPPTLYPNITASVPFKLAFLSSLLTVEEEKISVQDYLLAQPKSWWTGLFPSSEGKEKKLNSAVLQLTQDQENLFKSIDEEIIGLSVNDKEGYVSLSVNGKDPVVAAQMAELAKALLQEQVIAYKLEKLNDNLVFTQKQYDSKQREFQAIQDRLAVFKDRNQNISSSRFQSQLQRLQAEYDIALSVVQELAKQLETTKLQVNRDTPIFTVIEPVIVPYERDQPKRKLIVLIWTFLGGVLSCGWILVQEPIKDIWKQINN